MLRADASTAHRRIGIVAMAAVAPLEFSADTVGCRVPPAAQGEVEAVFERACNLALDGGGAIAVLTQDCSNHPHAVRLSCSPRLNHILRAGLAVRVTRNRIGIGEGAVAVLLRGAPMWSPALQAGMFTGDARAADSLLAAERLLLERAAGKQSDFLTAALGAQRLSTVLGARVLDLLPRLSRAWRAADVRECVAAIARVIGLGPGLTPAGDDFVVGWLAGMALAASSPARRNFLRAVCADLGPLRAATTPLSWQHLDDARALLFSERLSDLGVAIARCAPAATLRARIDAQLAAGATSGADAAAGLIAALRAATPGVPALQPS
jgi:hypothetical protein